jgi:hypothetical protein
MGFATIRMSKSIAKPEIDNAFDVPDFINAPRKSQNTPQNGLYSLFCPNFGTLETRRFGADIGADRRPHLNSRRREVTSDC